MTPRPIAPPGQGRFFSFALNCFLLFLVAGSAAAAEEDDVRCLRGVQAALIDPDRHLAASWNFSNNTDGFVCNFVGVSCWNPEENRVISLMLPSMSLSGTLPSALQYCGNATTLDLSSNALSGPIPPALCDWLPFLVALDLSSNSFTGPIPSELSNCRYLNILLLDNNSLSGSVPQSLGRIDRLKTISLADNQLSGQIPADLASFDSSSFDGNPSLCGRPLSSCGRHSSCNSLIIMLIAGFFGYATSLLIAYVTWRRCFAVAHPKKRKKVAPRTDIYNDLLPASLLRRGILMTNLADLRARSASTGAAQNSWADRLKSSHNLSVPIKLFRKPIIKVKLADLMTATSDFHSSHIIASGSAHTGTSYEADLRDGSALTVKRLHGCALTEKQFHTKMRQLGQLRHPNLVSLLGFCVVEGERLLVYKHMPCGSLSTVLSYLDWPTRLKIGIGAARGLAWLHHGFPTPFLHQSVTSAAILLDEEYEPRITESGVAMLVRASTSEEETILVINGEFKELGYIPPEYASNPVATAKGDVYSFGVVLLELVTGQKPTEVSYGAGDGIFNRGNLVEWVNQLWVAGRIGEAIDRALGNDHKIMELLVIACRCVAQRPKERPSMYKVYQSLMSIGEGYDFAQEFDDFPLNFGQDDREAL